MRRCSNINFNTCGLGSLLLFIILSCSLFVPVTNKISVFAEEVAEETAGETVEPAENLSAEKDTQSEAEPGEESTDSEIVISDATTSEPSDDANSVSPLASTIDSTVGVSLSKGNLSENLSPTSNTSKTAQVETTVTISIENAEDWSIQVEAEKEVFTGKDYADTIPSAVSGNEAAANSWAIYYADSGSSTKTYQAVTSSNKTITIDNGDRTKDKITKTYTLGIAANVDGTIKADTYENNFLVSVVTSPLVASTLADITYMQDMTSEICTNTTRGTEKSLIDQRGAVQYSYTVKKLDDDNCWMTQNLRLQSETAITSADSDLNDINSYTLPSNTAGAFSTSYAAQTMRDASGTYSEQYGAYYSWCVATANTCVALTSGSPEGRDATSSICPSGWKLPKGGTVTGGKNRAISQTDYNTATNYNDFAGLISYTGTLSTTTGINISTYNAADGGSYSVGGTTWATAGAYNSNGFAAAGSLYVWSRTATNTFESYNLHSGSNTYIPASAHNRLHGFSVRCIAYSL